MAHQFFFNPFILDNLPAPATGFDVVQDMSEPRLRMYVTSRGVKTFSCVSVFTVVTSGLLLAIILILT